MVFKEESFNNRFSTVWDTPSSGRKHLRELESCVPQDFAKDMEVPVLLSELPLFLKKVFLKRRTLLRFKVLHNSVSCVSLFIHIPSALNGLTNRLSTILKGTSGYRFLLRSNLLLDLFS